MKNHRIGLVILLGTLMLTGNAAAQVGSPKHESRWNHLFSVHRDTDNLQQRFDDLKCALVLIEAGQKLGTGFYTSSDGDIATASHVMGERSFSRNSTNGINVSIAVPAVFFVTNSKGERIELSGRTIEENPDAWVADVARIKTGKPTTCWLREADALQSHPGEHLIAMGFPGLSFKALTVYTGIVSARLTTNLPTVILNTGEAVQTSTEFIRVQMPISTGLSGGPIIDDENRAVAVLTNAGGWTQDLDHLMMAFHGGAFETPPPPPNPNQPPNTVSFNLNSMALTAELAGLFHDFASPGYGDAVPLRYLRKPQQQNQPPASPGH
jgi:S1-C subfamily serine protease